MKILRQMLQTPAASQEPADQEGALSSALTCAARPELIVKIIASAPGRLLVPRVPISPQTPPSRPRFLPLPVARDGGPLVTSAGLFKL